MKIYDCFSYWDEDLLLDVRLNILNDHVDYFVIVEGNKTWQNNHKDLRFDIDKFPKFKEAKVNTYILEKGDCILIPKRWWHCVENLEDTIGFTYKAYRWNYYYYHVPFELLRRYWYMLKGYTIADQYQCLKYD